VVVEELLVGVHCHSRSVKRRQSAARNTRNSIANSRKGLR
jgi:hypothetical protein